MSGVAFVLEPSSHVEKEILFISIGLMRSVSLPPYESEAVKLGGSGSSPISGQVSSDALMVARLEGTPNAERHSNESDRYPPFSEQNPSSGTKNSPSLTT